MLHANSVAGKSVFLLVAALVLARSAAFALPGVQFHADEAVTGLMAKHLAEGRAFPVFQYAHEYVLMVEAWLGALVIGAIGSVSPAIVKSIPIALNVVAALLLYQTLSRTAQLGPYVAALAILPLAVPGPTTTGDLTDALGMNIEPFVFAVLFWRLRQHPVFLGVIAAVAVLNRELTLYALAALVFVDGLRTRLQVDSRRAYAVALVTFAVTWAGVKVLNQYSSPFGPGTTYDTAPAASSNLPVATSFVCVDPALMAGDVRMVAAELLPLQLGLGHERQPLIQGAGTPPWIRYLLWPAIVALLLFGMGRGLRRAWRSGPTAATWFGLYLLLIGLQAVVVYATLRCGGIGPGNLRYMLLSLLAPVGAITLAMERERTPKVRAVFVCGIGLWTSICAFNHARLWTSIVMSPPSYDHQVLSTYLLQHRVRFIFTDYWTGYHVALLTDERIKPLTDMDRVLEYTLAVKANIGRAVEVRRRNRDRCPGAAIVAEWYVCPPPNSNVFQ
jgi:hypothetical protein